MAKQHHDTLDPTSPRSYEVSRNRLYRHHYTSGERFQQMVKHYGAGVMAGLLIFALLMPALTLPFTLLFIIVWLCTLTIKKDTQWLRRKPVYETYPNKTISMTAIDAERDGILFLGNDLDTGGKALWFSPQDLLTHLLLLGTTGSGKTQLMLSMMYQYMMLGSGFIFVDGKADVKTWFYLYGMARDLGLDDNVLVLNFLNAGDNKKGKATKMSNTLNPFSHGSSDTLMEMISGLMGKDDGNGMWRGRAEALGRCVLRALCEIRDNGELLLSIDVIRTALSLHKIEALAKHPALSAFAKRDIYHYLNELPGWRAYKEMIHNPDLAELAEAAKAKAYEQHGYLTMQFTKILELLSGTYAHITKTDLGEVDFKDVIANRRILYVMLPSLEKSPESLKDIGRMIVTNIRSALAGLLGGDTLTGDKALLLDAKPTEANIPFSIWLDEYGSYAVDGFGDIGAQARSLNVSVCFSGQEFGGFKKASEIEAGRIISNTGIKIFMQTDSEETMKIVRERAGEMYIPTATQLNVDANGLRNKTRESGNLTMQKVAKVNKNDMLKLARGEGFVFHGENMWRVKSFYGDFKLAAQTRVNSFVKIKRELPNAPWSGFAAKEWHGETKKVSHPVMRLH